MGDVIRSMRDIPPSGYIMKIEPFSLLSKLLRESDQERYESGEFEIGGFNWKMMIYPNGNKKSDVDDYISVYLAMTDAKKLTHGSEVNVLVKFFILDQIKGKYITFEEGRYISFSALKNMRGISRMLSLNAFKNSANGYLIDDCCTFGVEVMVVEPDRKGEKLTIIGKPDDASFSWNIPNFSALKDEKYLSAEFMIGGFKWKLHLYPTGKGIGEGKSLSLFLAVQDSSYLRPGWKVYATSENDFFVEQVKIDLKYCIMESETASLILLYSSGILPEVLSSYHGVSRLIPSPPIAPLQWINFLIEAANHPSNPTFILWASTAIAYLWKLRNMIILKNAKTQKSTRNH